MSKEESQKKYEKEDRAVVFNQALDRANVVTWKRAATVSKECEVSHATASGWLLGSLPRDVKALLRVRDLYNVDIDEWVHGESRRSNSLEKQKIVGSITTLKRYEKENGNELKPDKFAELVLMHIEEPDKTEYLLDNLQILEKDVKK